MAYHPIESLMKVTMDSIKDMVDVNTVVGEPVETKEGTVIIPVSRVSFGFVTGGGEESNVAPDESGGKRGDSSRSGDSESYASDDKDMPFTGGTGAGVSVRPVGFLVVGEHHVRFLPVDSNALFDRLLDEAPELLSRLGGAVGRRVRGENIKTEPEVVDTMEDEGEHEERRRGRRARRDEEE